MDRDNFYPAGTKYVAVFYVECKWLIFKNFWSVTTYYEIFTRIHIRIIFLPKIIIKQSENFKYELLMKNILIEYIQCKNGEDEYWNSERIPYKFLILKQKSIIFIET